MRPRALRLLDAGRAPARWLREAGRAAARTQAVERGARWVDAAAAFAPALRGGPLWGPTLGTVLSALATNPARADDPAPAAFPRGLGTGAGDAPARSASSSARAARSSERPAPPPPLRRFAAPSADPPGDAAAVARAASLPRRAADRQLTAWSAGAPSGTARRVRVDAAPGERRVWTPSPDALPLLAARDRLRGDVARRAASRGAAVSADQEHGRGWIGRVAAAVARRISRGASPVPAREAEGPADGWQPDGAPHRPPLSRDPSWDADPRIAPLVADWSSPVDGPAAPMEVLDRLARAARPSIARPPAERRGRTAPALPHPPARSAPSVDAGDGGRRFPPSPQPLFRRPRLAGEQSEVDADGMRRAPFPDAPFHRPRLAPPAGDDGVDAVRRAASPDAPFHRPRLAPGAGDDGVDADRRAASPDAPFHRPRLAPGVGDEGVDAGRRAASPDAPFHRPRLAPGAGDDGVDAAGRTRAAHPWLSPDARSAGPAGADAGRGMRRAAGHLADAGLVGRADAGKGWIPGVEGWRDRWSGWPVVLPWPLREAPSATSADVGERRARVTRPLSGGGGSRTTALGAAEGDAGDGAAPRAAQAARADASAPPVSNAVPSPSTFARAAVRQPPSVVREMAADGARPDGWLIDAVRSLPPAVPGSAGAPVLVPAAADPPGPPVAVAAPEGVGALGTGALPLPWFVGGEAEGDAGGGLDALAGRIRRILDDEARRHGIDL